jgi:hypothetical protein
MSSVDNDVKHYAVHKLGLSQDMVDTAWEVGKWTGAVISGAGFLIAAYTFLDKVFGSSGNPVQEKLDKLLVGMKTMMTKQDQKTIGDIANDLIPLASVIDTTGQNVRSFRDTPSPALRGKLLDSLLDVGGVNAVLLTLLGGKSYWFIPAVYTKPGAGTEEWVNGRFVFGRFYPGTWANTSWPSNQSFQVYEQPGTPLQAEWAVPSPLFKTVNRWDGLLCLPLILHGLPVWQAAMTQLEPFYRLTGVWFSQLEGMSSKLLEFGKNWLQATLWTREMPSWLEIALSGTSFLSPQNPPSNPTGPSPAPPLGFFSWPCGALDPIMGVEIVNPKWWLCEGSGTGSPTPEMWTAEQRTEFLQQRLLQHQKLDNESGFTAFMKIAGEVSKLKAPPSISPSLLVHPELVQVEHPSSGPPAIAAPKLVVVTDPGGTAWTAQVIRGSLVVTAPISVQPNPAPAPPHSPRAVSEVVFGYEITVTPTGGIKQKVKDWVWPLRISDSAPDAYHHASLYHNDDGSLRGVKYSKPHTFTNLPAETWETRTDGQFRERAAKAKGNVSFVMTVTVADLEPPGIPGDKSGLHGAIQIQIDADEDENQGRSFEVVVEVTETAAVDAYGNPQGDPKKTYTLQMPLPVDICRVLVPTGYFGWLARVLGSLQVSNQGLGIPIPDPDPDPVLELSLWHLVLEKNPVLLQNLVHDLRGRTGRPTLAAAEALEQIRTAARVLAREPHALQGPGIPTESERETGLSGGASTTRTGG